MSSPKTSFPAGLKRGCVMIVLRSGDAFLLLKRAKPPHQGLYAPVGGKVDPYEDPYQTGLRETWEETGIRPATMQYAGTLVETSPVDYNWWSSIYVADVPWQPAPPCDEGVLRWVAFDELATLPTPPTDWHIYQYIARRQPFAMRAVFDADMRLVEMVEEIEGVRLVGEGSMRL